MSARTLSDLKIANTGNIDQILNNRTEPKAGKQFNSSENIRTLDWSANGEFLAIVDNELSVKVFSIATGQEILKLENASDGLDLFWSSDNRYLATIDPAERLRFFDISGKEQIINLDLDNSTEYIDSILWSPNGEYLALLIRHMDKERTFYKIQVFDKNTSDNVASVEHRGSVSNVSWSPDSQYIASVGLARNSKVTILEVLNNTRVELPKESYAVKAIEWSPDGLYLVLVYSYSAQIFDISKRELVFDISNEASIVDMSWSPSGERIAMLTGDGKLRIHSGRNISADALFDYSGILSDRAIWRPDSQSVIVRLSRTTFMVLNSLTGSEILKIENSEVSRVKFIDWSPDGKYISTINQDYSVNIFDAVTGARVQHLEHQEEVYRILWSPDSQYLATYALDNVRVTEVASR